MIDNETLRALFEPIGAKIRTFGVDYKDMFGQDYNRRLVVIDIGFTDNEIVMMAKRDLGNEGFSVTAIHEILDIPNYERLISMIESDISSQCAVEEIRKYARPVYLNMSY